MKRPPVGSHHPMRMSAGFTLIEVLIAVLVFAVGLLGIVGLQVAGMRYTQDSQLRAVATMQAQDMADRMRANAAHAQSTGSTYNVTGSMPTSFATDCAGNDCTDAQLATYDLVQWNAANAVNLPVGSGVVCRDSNPADGTLCDGTGDVYSIVVDWSELSQDRDGTANDAVTKRVLFRVIL